MLNFQWFFLCQKFTSFVSLHFKYWWMRFRFQILLNTLKKSSKISRPFSTMSCKNNALNWKSFVSFQLNPYPWILEKIQNTGPSPSVFSGSNPVRNIASICICFHALDFFPESTLPKNGIYFCSARHISSHIGICHLKLASLYSPTGTLSAHIIFIS